MLLALDIDLHNWLIYWWARFFFVACLYLNESMRATYLLLLSLLTGAFALQPKFAEPVRESLKKYKPPQFSVILDGIQDGTYAFTDGSRQRTYIDFSRFANAPNSLRNVLDHELNHLLGRDHNNIPGDPMSYRLTVDRNGTIIEDSFIWAP